MTYQGEPQGQPHLFGAVEVAHGFPECPDLREVQDAGAGLRLSGWLDAGRDRLRIFPIAAFFGAGASRPIIRGLGADRSRVLEDGIGTGDVSALTAVSGIGKKTAERMVVMKDVMVAKGAVLPSSRLAEVAKIQDYHNDPVFFPGYACHPALLDCVEAFVGPDIKSVHNMLINKPPGVDGRHPLHQDLLYFPFRPADKMIAEIQGVLARYRGIGTFIFDDDLFTQNVDHAIAVCEAYAMTNDRSLREPAQLAINFICHAQDDLGGGHAVDQQRARGEERPVALQVDEAGEERPVRGGSFRQFATTGRSSLISGSPVRSSRMPIS